MGKTVNEIEQLERTLDKESITFKELKEGILKYKAKSEYQQAAIIIIRGVLEKRLHENGGLNIAGVSASLLPENVSIKDLKDVRQYFRTHDKTMREHKAFATIHYLIEHIEAVSNAR